MNHGAAQALLTYNAGSFVATVPSGFNGSAVTRSPNARMLVGMGVIRHNGMQNFEMYNAIAANSASTKLTCSSILKNYYQYNTSVAVQNVGTAATSLTVNYVDNIGRTILGQTLPTLQPGASWFNYTPRNADLPEGFNGAVVVQSGGQCQRRLKSDPPLPARN